MQLYSNNRDDGSYVMMVHEIAGISSVFQNLMLDQQALLVKGDLTISTQEQQDLLTNAKNNPATYTIMYFPNDRADGEDSSYVVHDGHALIANFLKGGSDLPSSMNGVLHLGFRSTPYGQWMFIREVNRPVTRPVNQYGDNMTNYITNAFEEYSCEGTEFSEGNDPLEIDPNVMYISGSYYTKEDQFLTVLNKEKDLILTLMQDEGLITPEVNLQ